MSLIDNIYTFYQDKIQNFSPFKNNLLYQSIISVILNHLVKYSYGELPEKFHEFVFNQIIDSSFYDPMLESLGYPKELLNKLSVTNKKIILNHDGLSDYNLYKGTLKFTNRLCNLFKESVNVYELYIDFLPAENKWTFTPDPLYIGSKDSVLNGLDYDEIYNKTNNFFITQNVLNLMKQNGSIVYPFKSNLILFQSPLELATTSPYTIITFFAILEYVKNYLISVLIGSNYFVLTILDFYCLSNYLIMRAYKTSDIYHSIDNESLVYIDYNGSSFPYTIDNINDFNNRYNETDFTIVDYSDFYKNNIFDVFYKDNIINKVTFEKVEEDIRHRIGDHYFDILNTYLAERNETGTISELVGSIKQSIYIKLLSHEDEKLSDDRLKIFFNFFPTVAFSAYSPTLHILKEFKPHHTTIINQSQQGLISHDKENIVVPNHKFKFNIINKGYSGVIISDYNCDFIKCYKPKDSTGYYFDSSNTAITDFKGRQKISVGDIIFSKNPSDDIVPLHNAIEIINIYEIDSDTYHIILSENYSGDTGHFDRICKYITSEIIEVYSDLEGGAWYFRNGMSTLTILDSSVFDYFEVGDYIYNDDIGKENAYKINEKNFATSTYTLQGVYAFETQIYSKVYLWRSG